MTNQKNQFFLDIRREKQLPMNIDITESITVGNNPRNDLVISGDQIKNRHLIFLLKGENLALHYLGNSNQTFLNSLPLEENKVYLLDSEDKIKLQGLEIIVREKKIDAKFLIKKRLNDENENIKIDDNQTLNENHTNTIDLSVSHLNTKKSLLSQKPLKNKTSKQLTITKVNLVSLWLVKLYSMLLDIFATYFILTSVLPYLSIEAYANEILKKFYFLILPYYKIENYSALSFIFVWYFLSLSQTLVFGTTIGQFLTGLKYTNSQTFGKLFLHRVKTFLYSIFLLPAQNSINMHPIFKGLRKVGIVFFCIFILFSPLFLPYPFNKFAVISSDTYSLSKEARTNTISSYSSSLLLNLETDLSLRYLLLPCVKNKQLICFQLFDLKTKKNILIYETILFPYSDIDKMLKYGNPLYSLYENKDFNLLPISTKKKYLEMSLTLTPINLKEAVLSFGPFYGSLVLIKKELLSDLGFSDTSVKLFNPETPGIFVGSDKKDYFYLFGPRGLTRLQVEGDNRRALVSIFEQFIFSKLVLRSEKNIYNSSQHSEILEAEDALSYGNEEALLTYYTSIVKDLTNQKIVDGKTDLKIEGLNALLLNIKSVKSHLKNQNVVNSFENIINQLTPMEKPGEKR